MIRNIYQLKTELITRNISSKDEMSGCSEKEIVEIETKYGKLPLSYREIISLIGHSAGFLAGDSSLYVSTEANIERIIFENEDFLEYKQETIENDEVDDDLLKIPENIFIIYVSGNDLCFVLTDSKKQIEDSPVYIYENTGIVIKKYLSVWQWIEHILNTSFDGDRNNISPFWLDGYRKPEYKSSGEIVIRKSSQDLDIVRPFFEGGRNQQSLYWLEAHEKLH